METAIQLRQSGDMSPAMMISSAISSGADLDKLEKLLELQERWEANEAKKAFNKAMAAFKSNPPAINKDRHVKFQTSKGVTEYDHASLANVTSTISSALSNHGLSASWRTDQSEQLIKVTCCITHEMGHQECTSLSAGRDDSGGKNAIQGIGSTVSYLQRYTLLSICGLATFDMDDDGNSSAGKQPELATAAQVKEINEKYIKAGGNANKISDYLERLYGVRTPEELTEKQAVDYIKALDMKIRGGK